MGPLIALSGVSKSFLGIQVLRDVSFDVRPGEVHALLGENGAGKSTLIKIMSGVFRPDAGEILVEGRGTSISPRPTTRAAPASRRSIRSCCCFPSCRSPKTSLSATRRAGGGPDRLARDARQGAKRCSTPRRSTISPSTRSSARCRSAIGSGWRFCRAAVARRAHPDHGRADGGVDRSRRRAAVQHRAAAEGRAASASSTSATGSTRFSQIADRVTVLRDGAYVGTAAGRRHQRAPSWCR